MLLNIFTSRLVCGQIYAIGSQKTKSAISAISELKEKEIPINSR